MKILIVEDEKRITSFIRKGLQYEGYTVDVAYEGETGLEKAKDENIDLIILDIMLPKKDGITLCRELRELGVSTPVIMLTAKDSIDDKVKGLDAGADDYLIKPFAFKELLARIRSLLRRGDATKQVILQVSDLVLDPSSREVRRGDKNIELSKKEYSLLEYLMRNKNQVLTRTMIAEHVWDYDFDSFTNTIDVYIRYLRKKVDDGFNIKLIRTIRGIGYKITEG
ncbi:MAG TPA: response regulator transcription factor [bacterium]|nr:response regulator transcription factor [bacterium]HPN67109.1 response regulator transcription factor [bacterium]